MEKYLTYSEFGLYTVSKLYNSSAIKKYEWPCVTKTENIMNFTTLNVQYDMPFTAYLIPRSSANDWCSWCYAHDKECINAVYILFGHNFIYVGKAINGDRIKDHVMNEAKNDFDYQLIFIPNKKNNYTECYWDSNAMDYLESVLIDIVKTTPYYNNIDNGQSKEKSMKHMNYNEERSKFIESVANDIIAAFKDITCYDYLLMTAEEKQEIINKAQVSVKKEAVNYKDVIEKIKNLMSDTAHKGWRDADNNDSFVAYNVNDKISATSVHYEFLPIRKNNTISVALHYEIDNKLHYDELINKVYKQSGLETSYWHHHNNGKIEYAVVDINNVEDAVAKMKELMNIMDPIFEENINLIK